MEKEHATIIFILIHAGIEYPVYTYRNEHYSLMSLISQYIGLPGFGLCSGMGSCGTCMIEVSDKGGKNRRSTIACDVKVNEDLANTIVLIPG